MQKKIFFAKVRGDSMSPRFFNEDIVKVDKTVDNYSVGDIILAEHPFRKNFFLIKQIAKINGDNFFISGINPDASTDSRHFGEVSKGCILGLVVGKVDVDKNDKV